MIKMKRSLSILSVAAAAITGQAQNAPGTAGDTATIHAETRVVLVDAVAVGLQSSSILASGRISGETRELALAPPVSLTQADIRELQLAKAAIAAGLRILVRRWGAGIQDLQTVYLAGAFGNYLNIDSARRIGLIEAGLSLVEPAGNTSLRGVKMALLRPSLSSEWIAGARGCVEHVPLAADPLFEETFIDCLAFGSAPFSG